MDKKIIILGGGSGGIVCANELRKRLSEEHRVMLIDRDESHIFYPSLLWLILGWRKPEQIQRPLSALNKKKVEFIQGEVNGIDLENHLVKVNEQRLNYNYLVVSLGAELNKSGIPKTDRIFNFYCLEGAKLVLEAINNFRGGRIAVLVSSMPFKCPAAPYEIALLLGYFFNKRNLRDKIDIQIFTPETLPMPTAGPVMGNAVKQMIEGQNIGFNPSLKLVSIDADKREIKFEPDRTEKFDMLLVVPPHQSPKVVKESRLAGETGWIPVDAGTMKTKYNGVYAIGDVTSVKLPNGKMLPKAGVFAHYQAEAVAHNIAGEIKGIDSGKEFNGRGSCFLEMGYGKAGYAAGNFYALPEPLIKLHKPGRIWHLGKILFEKYWFWKWF
ncbi:pyridine nucleotide-disulfide oxidoreductase [Candidatus Desantisbacteria bacterium CG_4_10_14_0_8_um_filter_48_22]|uniref:Pyridine nucleotide-disulfide oxidoreductase n=1 Tax=Candidatus Desantisbacteria bacterium CG_4_10_14_0_8_um_filter_48_22 TaxID=1974543 RepID=A0A2M7SCU4_9BACT|nr:MAG: pyridine nucleotide-disulfide oxidoreductase [Candidatus Desantisbacteria bacterium CG_4_10_14_0_8_um_filter_48_22]